VTENCQHCGAIHETTCPRIRSIEYHETGAIKRIEFHGPQSLPPLNQWGYAQPHSPISNQPQYHPLRAVLRG